MALLPHPVAQCAQEWIEASEDATLPCKAGSDTPATLLEKVKAKPIQHSVGLPAICV